MKILFITAHRLGDAVISLGVLNGLMDRYPEARFTVVCGPMVEELFQFMPRCERLLVLEKKPWNRHWFALWRHCVRQRWELVADLRSSLVSFGLRSRRRVVVQGGRRPGLRIAHQARAFGFAQVPLPRLWIGSEVRKWAETFLAAGSGNKEKTRWFALAPTAGTEAKCWPAAHFAELGQRWLDRGYRPLVFYGPGEREHAQARELLARLPEAWNLGGQLTLAQVAALLERCQFFVGNDSGLMHLAASVGIPSLGLFGPSCASQYAPAGLRARAVPAPGKEGAGNLQALEPAQVDQALLELLQQVC
ncbi:glycosyltransferase family 9 protein [Oecophyllibacter saccharovorans]|uniref:Glycosyltransferase family 9 protein n=1 Tax=Oecophyllibacter saccharovorans TaxID=2558360 RepID=A0A506UQU6_9PROT|nr:glycosyltransferase family 9 protein [Oecophyllibacter saccharovorans]TPW35716.1 glycosyltransferase family 9 protein [Oecophyllibacter saccharovorans]